MSGLSSGRTSIYFASKGARLGA